MRLTHFLFCVPSKGLAFVLFVVVFGSVQTARSATVTYEFSGGGFSTQTSGGIVLPSELTNLTFFSGQFEIDDTIADSASNTNTGIFNGAALSLNADYNTGFSVSGSNGKLDQSRFSLPSGPVSTWSLHSFSSMNTSLSTSLNLVAINFSLGDQDTGGQNLFLDPNTLLSSLPVPGMLDNLKRLELVFQDGSGGTGYIRGQLSELNQVVPAPASSWLLLSGMLLIGFVRLRKKNYGIDPVVD